MDPITISHLPVVSGGLLHGGRVTITNVEVVDGKTFFHVSKSDREIERLLLGRVAAKERVLQHVMLFDAMLTKRQEAVSALLEPPAEAADDLCLDQPAKKKIKKSKNVLLPKFVPVRVLAMDNSVVEMNVLVDTGKKLFIELTESNIEVLQAIVSHQIDNRAPRLGTGFKQISFNAERNCFVVHYADQNKSRQKFFRVVNDDMAAAKLKAIQFWENRK